MLKVKYLTLFKPKMEKGGNFDQGCKKNPALLDFFCNPVSRFSLILTKIWFSIECKWFQGANSNIKRVMTVFSPTTSQKMIFFKKISSKWPPQEESKCKNAQFLQWILKGGVVYFQKITAS